ncbi:hypothetical protein [Rheinheimera nanhaiensis]|uniref:hypothetical protein n=1 Tax=Rheinheimera nanhaiensis TaxID=1163621 RepID=UPI00058CDD40|nr:hypothetical protein [Rheinheimera nanhaiensis]
MEKNNGKTKDLVIEAGMQLIPYVGGSLATIYFGSKQERRFARLESFYSELADEIRNAPKQLSLSSQDPAALEAIIELIHEKVEAEPLEEKRKYLRNYYKSTLESPIGTNFDERKHFLEAIAQMSLLECELLGYVKDNPDLLLGEIQRPGIEQYAIVGAVGTLKLRGFVIGKQDVFNSGGTTDNALFEKISISAFGSSFYEFCLRT